mgnify:CR=1 FL=1
MPTLYEILYTSTLAPTAQVTQVAGIVTKARARNAELDLTGLLVFDGLHFCQQIEGSREEVLKLMKAIQADTRHTGVKVVHQGPLAERRFLRFTMGYVASDDEDALMRIEQADGAQALQQFLALIPELALDPC